MSDPRSTAVEKYVTGTLATAKPLPDVLANVINLKGWLTSLVSGANYEEPDPDALARMMLLQTLSAQTLDEVFANNGIMGLQDRLPQTPGATTGNIEIRGMYVSATDMDEGLPTYMIWDVLNLETGDTYRTTTGAGQLQMQCIRALTLGMWPIRGKVVRLDRKDKGGKYLLHMFPCD